MFQAYSPLSNYSISVHDLYIYLILYDLFACILLYNCLVFTLLYCVYVAVCVRFRGVPLRTFWLLAIPTYPFIIYSMVLYIIIFSGNQGYTTINFKINRYIFCFTGNNPYICTSF